MATRLLRSLGRSAPCNSRRITAAANFDTTPFKHIDVRPLAGALGAELLGVDVRKVDDKTWAEVQRVGPESARAHARA
jgi:hypothetical protein